MRAGRLGCSHHRARSMSWVASICTGPSGPRPAIFAPSSRVRCRLIRMVVGRPSAPLSNCSLTKARCSSATRPSAAAIRARRSPTQPVPIMPSRTPFGVEPARCAGRSSSLMGTLPEISAGHLVADTINDVLDAQHHGVLERCDSVRLARQCMAGVAWAEFPRLTGKFRRHPARHDVDDLLLGMRVLLRAFPLLKGQPAHLDRPSGNRLTVSSRVLRRDVLLFKIVKPYERHLSVAPSPGPVLLPGPGG